MGGQTIWSLGIWSLERVKQSSYCNSLGSDCTHFLCTHTPETWLITALQIFGNSYMWKQDSKKVTTLYLQFFSCEDLASNQPVTSNLHKSYFGRLKWDLQSDCTSRSASQWFSSLYSHQVMFCPLNLWFCDKGFLQASRMFSRRLKGKYLFGTPCEVQ